MAKREVSVGRDALGWSVDHVIKEDPDDEIVQRAARMLRSRGWKP